MKLWTWFKGLGWVAIVGAIVTAILMVLGSAKVSRQTRAAKHLEDEITALAHDRTKHGIAIAAKKQKQKDELLDSADATLKLTEARLEKISEDDTMADIAERFNNRRVRKRADRPA